MKKHLLKLSMFIAVLLCTNNIKAAYELTSVVIANNPDTGEPYTSFEAGSNAIVVVTYSADEDVDIHVPLWGGNTWMNHGEDKITATAGVNQTIEVTIPIVAESSLGWVQAKPFMTTVGGDWDNGRFETPEIKVGFNIVEAGAVALTASYATIVVEEEFYTRGTKAKVNVTYTANQSCDLILEFFSAITKWHKVTSVTTTLIEGTDVSVDIEADVTADFPVGQIVVKSHITNVGGNYEGKVAEIDAGNFMVSMPTSSSNINNNNNVAVYPNPTSDFINVTAELGSTIELYNTTGQLLNQIVSSGSRVSIPVTDLTPGLYVIKVSNQGDSIIKKVLVK